MADVAAITITELYRKRWQIEVFFKFLKQHLGLEHLLSYEQKAIEVMLYVRLIAAMLILIYKQKNQLSSYKIAKEKFVAELEMQLIKQLIADCGGNPALLTQNIGLFKLW
jgi:IS4 transposase